MIEVVEICDLLPGIDQQAYREYAKKEIGRKTPGVVEKHAHRNLLGSPQVRLTVVWQTLADWANALRPPNDKRRNLNSSDSRPT